MLEVLSPIPTTYSGYPGVQNGVTLPTSLSWNRKAYLYPTLNASMDKVQLFPININIKMRPSDNARIVQDGESGEQGSADGRRGSPPTKLMIPAKEKFLPGFRGFDAPVGLLESPTETLFSETDGFPASPPIKRMRSDSTPFPGDSMAGLSRSISETQFTNNFPVEEGMYVADGFRPGSEITQALPSYDAIYGPLGQMQPAASVSAPQLPTKQLHTVPSISLFNVPASPATSSPSTPGTSTPVGPLITARFPETANVNPRRIQLPVRAPSTPGLGHTQREMLRIQIRSTFTQFFKTMQFSCNDTEKCLKYGYSDSSFMKVPWNIPLERTLRQLWKQLLEYDAACDKSKPESQGTREMASYQSVAMGLISSDLSSERLCKLWDKSLAFSVPARRDFVKDWLSFTEFIAVVWMVGMGIADSSL